MKNKLVSRLSVCFMLFLSFNLQAKSVVMDNIVAIVNKEVILKSELENKVQLVKKNISANSVSDIYIHKQVLEQMIIDKIQLQMIKYSNIDIQDDEIDQYIKKLAQDSGVSIQDVKKSMFSEHGSIEKAREDIRNLISIYKLREGLLLPSLNISSREIDNYLKSPEGQKKESTLYLVKNILISLPDAPAPDEIRKSQDKINNLYKKLQSGSSFSEIAINYSNGKNALKGGDLGLLAQEQLPNLFNEKIQSLNNGEITQPFRSAAGFHILKLVERKGNEQFMEEKINLKRIIIRKNNITNEKQSKEQEKKLALNVYEKAKTDEFSQLAQQYSNDTKTSENGGNLGWIFIKDLPEDYQQSIKNSRDKELIPPFLTKHGWVLLKIEDNKTEDITVQMQRDKAKKVLLERKFNGELDAWLRKIRNEASVEIRL